MRQGDKGTFGGFGVNHHGNGNRAALADVQPIRSILSALEERIGELTINLNGIKKRIDFFHKLPVQIPLSFMICEYLIFKGEPGTWNKGILNLNIYDMRRPSYDKFRNLPAGTMS